MLMITRRRARAILTIELAQITNQARTVEIETRYSENPNDCSHGLSSWNCSSFGCQTTVLG